MRNRYALKDLNKKIKKYILLACMHACMHYLHVFSGSLEGRNSSSILEFKKFTRHP
jgi:hypothetical protein